MDLFQIFVLVCLVVLAIGLYMMFRRRLFEGGVQDDFKTYETGDKSNPTIVLVPGLGNGKESFNWNMSTEEQRSKVGLSSTHSLQQDLSNLGFHVVSFDPPGYGDNQQLAVPTAREYCKLIHNISPSIKLIIGHSLGARIAQIYNNMYGTDYIMLDPPPNYLLDEYVYTKHLDDPSNQKYKITYEYLEMIKKSNARELPWNPLMIIYSVDDSDSKRGRWEEYFEKIQVKKIKLHNATHWLHVSKPDVVIDAVREWKLEKIK